MRIKELDFDCVPDSCVLVCIGRRKSGKTVNITDIFYKKRNRFKSGVVFCGSKATIKDYEKHIPSSFIHDGYHSDVLGRIIDKQEEDVERGVAKPIFVLVDDCMYDKKSILTDPNIRRIFMNGRHALIFFVLSMQYSMDLHPSLRQQIDFVFLSREKNPHYREKLYANYNVCFRSFEQFDKCMMTCTLNFETFVLSSASETQSDDPEDNVFWYKSKYVAGGRKYKVNKTGTWWRYHTKRFNPKFFIADNNALTTTPLLGKGKGGTMTVHKVRNNPLPTQRPPSATHTSMGMKWIQKQRTQNVGARRTLGSGIKVVDQSAKYVH